MMRLKAGAAALMILGSVFAAAAAHADTIQNPTPAPGLVLSYTLSGTGTGALVTPGSDQSMPLEIQTLLAVQRKVTDARPDGTVTTLEKVTRNDITVNGQGIGIGRIPPVTITTDPSGKITQLTMNGKPAQASPGYAELGMEMWKLPNKEYKAGDTWTYTVPLKSGGAADNDSNLVFTQTYVGLKPLKDRSLIEVTSHLQAPVTFKPRSIRPVGGFSLSSVKIRSVDQTAYFDPNSGALVFSDISLAMDLGVQMGQGDAAMAMSVKMPLTVKTELVKTPPATAPETSPAAPAPDASPSPTPAPRPAAPDEAPKADHEPAPGAP